MKKINPFKFGSVVDEPYFTNRNDEMEKIHQILNSGNHLIMISPRRFGKTSLIHKAFKQFKREVISLDIQLVNSVEDLAAQCLKRVYKVFPSEKIKQYIRNFRIIPVVSLQPITNEVEISFQGTTSSLPILEDVFNLIDKLGSEQRRVIVFLDEFQDILRLEKGIDRHLRSIMQLHKNVNYIFAGSQESMMREIFEKKKSPFYHFGLLFYLQKIDRKHFSDFMVSGFNPVCNTSETITHEILEFSDGHPYYTQQLAYSVWNILIKNDQTTDIVAQAIAETIQVHDYDYERLWNTFNNTDKKILTGLANSSGSQISSNFIQLNYLVSPSTAFSSIKRLMQQGMVIKTENGFEIDDPFFRKWILLRRKK